ncbi:MAG: VWA domain-containing protein [Desulfovibrionaceae bacterium]|nr:VWA domain-containing protein [Desulfovibrionaceae bacterium]
MCKYLLIALTVCLLLCGPAGAEDITVKRVDTSDWPTVRVIVEALGREQTKGFMMTLPAPGTAGGANIAASGVTELSESPRPASIVVALDTSRSLSPAHLKMIKDSLARYVDELDKDEQVALLAFNDSVELASGFTSDRETFKQALARLRVAGESTELYRAMLSGLELMKYIPGRRALLVITDGKDEGGSVSREEILHMAEANDIRILAIGLATLAGNEPQQYPAALKELAEASGGDFRFAASAEALQEASYELLRGERDSMTRMYEAVFGIPEDIRPSSGQTLDAVLSRIYRNTTQTAGLELKVPATIGQAAASLAGPPIHEKNKPTPPPGVKTLQVTLSDYLAMADTEGLAAGNGPERVSLSNHEARPGAPAANETTPPEHNTKESARPEPGGSTNLLWGTLLLALFIGLLLGVRLRFPGAISK